MQPHAVPHTITQHSEEGLWLHLTSALTAHWHPTAIQSADKAVGALWMLTLTTSVSH
jgi:hypothetical protein